MRAGILNAYPRIGDTPEEQALRRAIARHDEGEISDQDLADAQQVASRLALQEQEAAGLDVVTDGLVGWHDPVSHLARGLGGFDVTGLLRWFDTNTYIRQPAARGPPTFTSPITVPALEAARRMTRRPVKAVVTGPITLAAYSRPVDGGSTERLAYDLIAPLAEEVRALAAAGAAVIQVDEPSLTQVRRLPAAATDAATAFARAKGGAELVLATYFGGVSGILPDLLSLPYDSLALDLVQGAETLPALRRVRTEKGLHLALIDARNTRLEVPAVIAKEARDLVAATGTPRPFLTTSNSLEFLPRAKAREKLRVLAEAARLAGGGP